MTPTTEERAAWRGRYAVQSSSDARTIIIRLLDALDAAEAREREATADRDRMQKMVNGLIAHHIECHGGIVGPATLVVR